MIFNPNGKSERLMTDSQIIHRYIHGGKGVVTLVNPNSLNAHSYSFQSPRGDDFPDDTIFVYAIHEGKRFYLGQLNDNTFRLTQGSSFGNNTESVRGARYIVRMSIDQELVSSERMQLYHSGKCCVCGRKLKTPSTLRSGIGKVCMKVYEARLKKVPWDGN